MLYTYMYSKSWVDILDTILKIAMYNKKMQNKTFFPL